MKKIWLEILLVCMWTVAGVLYLIRGITGIGVIDHNWINWACSVVHFLNAGLWTVIAYKHYKFWNAR